MTITTTDLLLEATGVSKIYGAVVALKSASLAVRPGEVHALMGANGAGKSTLVKILTGAVRPDGGTIAVRGRERTVHSPGEARRGGLGCRRDRGLGGSDRRADAGPDCRPAAGGLGAHDGPVAGSQRQAPPVRPSPRPRDEAPGRHVRSLSG